MRSLIAILLVSVTVSAFAQRADTVLLHGKVYTGDPAKFAQAIAISGKRIVAVGTDDEISALIGSGTEKFDLKGQTVIPGINDAHAQLAVYPDFLKVATNETATWADITAALNWGTDESSADKWIIGQIGPQVLNDPNATGAALEKLAKGRKIVLMSPSGHAALWSDAAQAAIRAGSMSDPAGGHYGHDASGRINGQAFEYAQFALAQRLQDAADDATIQQAIRELANRAVRSGVTSMQIVSLLPYSRFHRAVMRADVPVRIREIEMTATAAPVDASHAVLYAVDGDPSERGAAISGEYPGTKDSGTLNLTTAQIAAILATAKRAGQQPIFHASGDRAIRVVLDAIAAAGADAPQRIRIEYADGLSGDLLPMAAKLGVVAVQHPRRVAMKELYPATRAYDQLKPIVAAQVPLAFGADTTGMPLVDLMVAASSGLTVAQAIDAFTRGSAYAEAAEKDKGAIAPGQLADLAVLSNDIFTAPPSTIATAVSAATIIDGKVVFGSLGKTK